MYLLVVTALVLSLGMTACLEPEHTPPDPIECGDPGLYMSLHDSCEPMEATGDGACHCMLGYAWTGGGCEAVTGCECTGVDCVSLTETEQECIDIHGGCEEDPPVDEPCAPMDAEGDNECYMFLGYAWDGAECVLVGGCECTGEDCDELYEDLDLCIADNEECVEDPPVEDPCDPMDAEGDGLCYAELGYTWDGTECALVGGCECVGDDCDELYLTEEECVAATESCIEEPPVVEPLECGDEALYSMPHDSCEAMDAIGQGACYCAMGFAWNGSECVSLSGSCECVGEDCESIYMTEEECVTAHESC